MLRRHFMTGTELPYFIITYYAPEHIPFWCGIKNKNINSVLNYGSGILDNDTNDFTTPIIFDVILDKWENGVGEWGIKIKNTTQMSYYSHIKEGSNDNLESLKMGTADYYVDLFNTNLNYANKITNIIFPEGLTHINGSPLYCIDKNTSCLSITLPDSIKYLTGSLFGNYDSLKSIIIPPNVKRIDNLCFICDGNDSNSNLSLEEVILKPVTPPDASYSKNYNPLGTYYKDKVYNNLKIRVYSDCIDTYKNDAVWGLYSKLYDTINNAIVYYTKDGSRKIYEQNDIIINTSSIDGEIKNATLLHLPHSVTTLSLDNYPNLKKFVIPNSITSLISISLCNELENLVINNNIINIENLAINNCSNLQTLVFNNDNISLWTVMDDFTLLILRHITIGDSVIDLGDADNSMFVNLNSIIVDSNNSIYDSREQCNAIIHTTTNTLIKGCLNTIIPNSVISIGDNAFSDCLNLTSIIIPNSVISIGKLAFYWCSSLTSVTIGNGVTSIKEDAFNCLSLTKTNYTGEIAGWCNIKFSNPLSNPMYCSHNFYVNDVEIKDLVIPSTVGSIYNYTFCGCSSLTSITIPNSVTSIGYGAFSGCKSLTSVTIPNSVTSIGKEAFYNCASLTSITIPNSVTSIGDYAFYGCSSLPVENNLRYADTYLVGAIDKTLSTYVIKEGTQWIGPNAFANCSSLISVTIPNSVKNIEYRAFSACDSLSSVTLPESVKNIGNYAFYSCSKLTSINIPDEVTSIGDNAFAHCYFLRSITIPDSVTRIGSNAFYYCDRITSIIIGNGVTSIGDDAFSNCDSIVSITFNGLKEQWKKINLGSNWNYNVPATVIHCIDGDIEI